MARPRGEGHEGDLYRGGKEVVFFAEVQRQEIVFGYIAYSNFLRRRHGEIGRDPRKELAARQCRAAGYRQGESIGFLFF